MASEIFFTTNPAEWSQLPGVYISERNPPGFITGVNLSTVGFAGKCVRGPAQVVECDSAGRFLEVFGGRDYVEGGTLHGEVWKALTGRRFSGIRVRRVIAADATTATENCNDDATPVLTVAASSPGAWAAPGNGLQYAIENATSGDADQFNVRVVYRGQTWLYEDLDISGAGLDNLAAVVGDDPANAVVLTKLANGRPDNVALGDIAGGTDGTLTAAHYSTALDELAAYDGIGVILVPEVTPTQTTTNQKLVALAATVADRLFLAWSGEHDQAVSAETSDFDTDMTTRSDRVIWCYNSIEQRDPESDALMDVPAHVVMATILANTDVDIHPGAPDNAVFCAAATRVKRVLSRAELITLKNKGICALEKTSTGFVFRDGVTTSLTSGRTEITRRRMTDFLQLSASARLRSYVKAKSTRLNRATMAAEVVAFSQGLKDSERIVEDFSLEQESVNTAAGRAQGLEKLFWNVRLIGHMLNIVLETNIGTGVTVEAA